MNTQAENVETGMELRDLLMDVDFAHRPSRSRNGSRGWDAFLRLARAFAEGSESILQELVNIAVEFCGADSAGISLEEADLSGEVKFRWVAIAGSFSRFLNGTAPGFFSPCGTCLIRGTPQLYRVTKRYYDYLGIEGEPVTDGILIPWVSEGMRGTLWVVAHESRERFDFEDYKLLESLADFAAVAIRHQIRDKAQRDHEKNAALMALVNELAHQINNPLQGLTNVVYLSRIGSQNMQFLLALASEQLERLSRLVKDLLTVSGKAADPQA